MQSSGPAVLGALLEAGEERRVSVGYLDGRLIVVAYTLRDGNIRIISMRKADKREQLAYG